MTKRRPSEAKAAPKPKTGPERLVGTFLALVLVGLGVVLGVLGTRAIVHGYFESDWSSSTGLIIGPLDYHESEGGWNVLVGWDAACFGAGLASLGLMLALWSLGILLNLWLRPASQPQLGLYGHCTTVVSLGCLAVATLSFFPPWLLSSASFYVAAALLAWAFYVAVREPQSQMPKRMLPALIVAAVIVSQLGFSRLSTGIVLALIVTVIAILHLFILHPRLRAVLDRHQLEPDLVADDS